MRKEYGKVLRKYFDRKIKEEFPEFLPKKISTIYFTPGDRAFEKVIENGSSLWINLSINAKFESFTVEIGWSTLGRWPELSMRPSPDRPNGSSEFSKEEYLTRLAFLWTSEDIWFEVEPFKPNLDIESIAESLKPIEESKAQARVMPVLEACFEEIAQHAIPYFEKYTSRKA